MKIKTLNTFSVVTLPLAPCQTKWFQNYLSAYFRIDSPLAPCQTEWFQNEIDLSETELNPLAPCQTEWFQNKLWSVNRLLETFGTMSNRMVPKPRIFYLT